MRFATGITLMLVAVLACGASLGAVLVMLPFIALGGLPGWMTGGLAAVVAASVVIFWTGALLVKRGTYPTPPHTGKE